MEYPIYDGGSQYWEALPWLPGSKPHVLVFFSPFHWDAFGEGRARIRACTLPFTVSALKPRSVYQIMCTHLAYGATSVVRFSEWWSYFKGDYATAGQVGDFPYYPPQHDGFGGDQTARGMDAAKYGVDNMWEYPWPIASQLFYIDILPVKGLVYDDKIGIFKACIALSPQVGQYASYEYQYRGQWVHPEEFQTYYLPYPIDGYVPMGAWPVEVPHHFSTLWSVNIGRVWDMVVCEWLMPSDVQPVDYYPRAPEGLPPISIPPIIGKPLVVPDVPIVSGYKLHKPYLGGKLI